MAEGMRLKGTSWFARTLDGVFAKGGTGDQPTRTNGLPQPRRPRWREVAVRRAGRISATRRNFQNSLCPWPFGARRFHPWALLLIFAVTFLPVRAVGADLTVFFADLPAAFFEEAFSVTAKFSEPVADFTKDDITCENCEVLTEPVVQSDMRNYAVEITPTGTANVRFKVNPNTVTAISDGANNQGSAWASVGYDAVAPVPLISVQSTYSDETSFEAQITFREHITGFDEAGDVLAQNATASAPLATASPFVFKSTITPDQEKLEDITIIVPRNAAKALSGRGSDPVTASVKYEGPTVKFNDLPLYHGGDTFYLTVEFSEAVSGFSSSGIECDGCVAGTPIHRQNNKIYSVPITPDDDWAVLVQIKAGAATSVDGGHGNSVSEWADIGHRDGPILNRLTPADGSVLGGTSVTLYGSFGSARKNKVHFGSELFGINDVVGGATSLTLTTKAAPDGWPEKVDVYVEVIGTDAGTSNVLEFEYTPVIKLDSLSVTTGKAGDTVTLTGEGFEDGSTTVYVNDAALDASAVTFKSTTELDIVMPRQGSGPDEQLIGVGVSGKGKSNRIAFTYVLVPPTLTSLSVTSGPLGGGTTVTLYGTEFIDRKTKVNFGTRTLNINQVTFVSSTEISVTAPTSTQAGMTEDYGSVDVSVEVDNAGTSSSLPFTYYTENARLQAKGGSFQKAKINTAYTANFAANISTSNRKFVEGAVVTFSAPTSGASGTFSNGLTSIDVVSDANGDVSSGVFTANGTTGDFNVTATSLGTTDVTYPVGNVATTSVPAITSVSPGAGPKAGGDTLTILGTNFLADDLVNTAVKVGTAAATVTAVTSTTITATTAAHSAGTVDVQVTTLGGGPVTKSDAYRYLDAPRITSLSREVGPPNTETEITITGTNFLGADAANTTVEFSKGQFGTVSAVTDTSITVTAPPLGVGSVDVIVTTLGGSDTETDGYTYAEPPTLDRLSPQTGDLNARPKVVLHGTYFVPKKTFVQFGGTRFNRNQVTVNDEGTTATVDAPSSVLAGTVDVSAEVINNGTTGTKTFTYAAVSAPTITSYTPQGWRDRRRDRRDNYRHQFHR